MNLAWIERNDKFMETSCGLYAIFANMFGGWTLRKNNDTLRLQWGRSQTCGCESIADAKRIAERDYAESFVLPN